MKYRYDVAEVYAALKRIAESDPGRRDEHVGGRAPRYAVHGAPNCFVAVALTDLGCGIGVLRALDRETASRGLAGVQFMHSLHPYLRRISPAARALLASVQRHQDYGDTWSVALTHATGAVGHWLDARYHSKGRPWMPLPKQEGTT